MRLFRKQPPTIKGYIGYYKLTNWWIETFTEEERTYMEEKYRPLSTSSSEIGLLTQADIGQTSQSLGTFMSGLATWFRSPQDRHLAIKILQKAEEIIDPRNDILGLHFTLQGLIQAHYRERDNIATSFDRAIDACKKQIAIAPQVANKMKTIYPDHPLPSHVGYWQLVVIRDKQGRYEEAIRLCEDAKLQGWGNTTKEDWDKRIAKYTKKLKQSK